MRPVLDCRGEKINHGDHEAHGVQKQEIMFCLCDLRVLCGKNKTTRLRLKRPTGETYFVTLTAVKNPV